MERLISPMQEFGLLGGCLYSIDRVLSRVSSKLRLFVYEILVQPVATKPLLPARWAKKFSYREILEHDPEVRVIPVSSNVLKYRYKQGAICLGAFKNGELIGYVWFCKKLYQEDEVRCLFYLEPVHSSVFDFDLYIFPKHRGSLAFAAVWQGASNYLSNQGIEYAFSRVTRFNLVSLRSHLHLGSRSIGKAIFLRIFFWEVLISNIFPFLSLSASKNQRIKIRLHP